MLINAFYNYKIFKQPIKCAIVISTSKGEGVSEDVVKERVKEVCRFLKSLPEASNMPIYAVSKSDSAEDGSEMRLMTTLLLAKTVLLLQSEQLLQLDKYANVLSTT